MILLDMIKNKNLYLIELISEFKFIESIVLEFFYLL